MSIDRASALRNAEKLLRQGRLDQAIAEYLRVVENQPRDWSTANTLGDLYVRANQIDKAVEQFARIAESFFREGFLPKAGALYRKILKLKPDEERALSRAADIAAQQGLFVDARAHLNAIAERQRGRGDLIGAATTAVRSGALDPTDYDQRRTGARARFELLDVPGAVAEREAIAEELTDKNRPTDALREAARSEPLDSPPAPQAVAVSAPQPPPAPSRPLEEPSFVQWAPVTAPSQNVEVDLSVVLDDIPKAQPLPPTLTGDLDGVFAQLRDEASKRLSMDSAKQDLQRGIALYGAGQFEDAEPALERASRTPRFRFEAAFTLGRICRARGKTWPAIDWLERAAQAPPSSAEQGHRLLFELADLLESVGEVARALAICLELQAEAGAYEDVDARVERLAKVQTTPG